MKVTSSHVQEAKTGEQLVKRDVSPRASRNDNGVADVLVAPPASKLTRSAVHTEGSFQVIDDVAKRAGTVTLFEQTWRPASTPRGVLVIVHGLKDHSSNYEEIARELANDGIAVYAYDLRGHGRSGGKPVAIRSFDEHVADLGTFMARVSAANPGVKPFLMGHSMGGAIATQYTLAKKPAISGLITSGAAYRPLENDLETRIARSWLGSLLGGIHAFKLDDTQFSRDPAEVAAMKSDPLVHGGAAPLRTAHEILVTQDAIHAHANELEVPYLAMHGGADKVTNPEGSREVFNAAASKDKTLEIFPGFFHNLLHEPTADRARVKTYLRDWLGARTSLSR